MNLLFKIGFIEVNLIDFFDITLVAILLYYVYKFIRGSVAYKAFLGFIFIYLIYLVVKATRMELLTEILGQFMGVGVLAVIIVFQQEIRKFLLLIGKTTDLNDGNTLIKMFNFGKKSDEDELNVTPVLDAMKSLSSTHTGALIVISRNDDLRHYANTGDILDAVVSKRMLLSIFFKNSPLHDGAVIINKGRIWAARCILPVSENPEIPPNLGLRHRAGVGLTESTDAIVLVVSEQTGQMSLIQKGEINYNLTINEIWNILVPILKEEKNAESGNFDTEKSA